MYTKRIAVRAISCAGGAITWGYDYDLKNGNVEEYAVKIIEED